MDALILAAGFGRRLRDISISKPLALIAGVPLIELSVRQAVRAGAQRVVVVTGYRAEMVEAVLPALAAVVDVPVIAERVEDWSLPNGYSVLAGARQIEGEYLLMMADHIFSHSILSQLVTRGRADSGVTLAIDKRISHPLIDAEDATWVRTGRNGFIREIGKSIHDYDAVDCGAFLATSELGLAIADAIAAGRPGSLSDGMQRLADAGRAATMDVGDAWWIDVDDPRAHALAEAGAPSMLAEIYDQRACGGVVPLPIRVPHSHGFDVPGSARVVSCAHS